MAMAMARAMAIRCRWPPSKRSLPAGRDDRALRLVRSVVGLAREFGLDVIAEGISAAGHLTVLQDIGCTHGQGPLFSSAVEGPVISRMLHSRPW